MKPWERDKRWSDRFIPAIKAAVAPHLLVEAPLELDVHENTDLLVFRARDMRIAARVRQYEYLARYGHEFTLRYHRDTTDKKVEFAKIVDGWGDWMLYGFASAEGDTLAAWRLLDLDVLRAELIRIPRRHELEPWVLRGNGDGTRFAVLSVARFPANLVIDSHGCDEARA